MSEQSSNELGAFLAGFVIGGLIGAATAIILAPQSGEETRAQIAAKSNDVIHAGSEQYYHYRDVASNVTHEYMDKAAGLADQTREQVNTASGRVQEQARIVLDRGKEESVPGNNDATADNEASAADDETAEG